MKLLVITPTLSDKGLAASYRLIHLLVYFLRQGIFITIYTSDSDLSNNLSQYRNYLKVKVIKISKNSSILEKVRSRLFGIPDSIIFWGNRVKEDILKINNCHSFDAIFVSSPPHSLQVVGENIANKLDIPNFTDFRDDWIGSHRLKHLTPFHKYLSKKAEYSVFKHSKLITQAIPLVTREWKSKFPEFAEKIYTLTNGYPNEILEYKESIKTVKYPQKAIVYFGGAYNSFVVNQFRYLRRELIRLGLSKKWMIVTGGPFEIPFKNDDIWIHYGNVPQYQVYDYLYNATIHISLLPPGDLFPSRTIPVKLYTQITTNGTCVFIGNNGAVNEVSKNIEGIYFLGENGWERLALWIKENENMLINNKYDRNNIERFNYDYIGKKLLELMLNKLSE